jgi:hypothetical protein
MPSSCQREMSHLSTTVEQGFPMNMRKFVVMAATAASLALAVPGTALAAVSGSSAPSHVATHAGPLAPRTGSSSSTPDYQLVLHPRVGCGGGDGTLQWGGNGTIAIPGYLSYDGNVYNYCTSGTVYMYLSYSVYGSDHNINLGGAGPGANNKVHYSVESDFATYAGIRVDACQEYNKSWTCGKAVGPGA